MLYGYARVSSKEQSIERQIKILVENGVQRENIFIEFASGKTFKNRPIYQKLIEDCAVDDVILFTALDRFSRNVVEAMEQLRKLEKRRIKAKFIKEGITTEMSGIAFVIISIMSWVAEQERIILKERQAQGYKALKRDKYGRMISNRTGKVIGRTPIQYTAKQQKMIEDYKLGKSPYNKTNLAKMLGISRGSLYKVLKTETES